MHVTQFKITKFLNFNSAPGNHQKDITLESQEKIHTREEIKTIFEEGNKNGLSTADCEIIIDFLMTKHSVIIVGQTTEMLYNHLKGFEKLYFSSLNYRDIRITLNYGENYTLISNDDLNDTAFYPMQEVYNLFEE